MNAARVPDGGSTPVPEPRADLLVQLVPMRRRHLRGVLRIEAQVYPRPWSVSLFMSELALRGSRSYTVARVGGTTVGYCGLMLSGEDAHVTTVAVDPGWQRHQVGTRLMLHMAHSARQRGVRHMTLEVRVANQAAQGLYYRFGFQPAGIRKNYYSETNEDALVMWANDIDTASYDARLTTIASKLSGATTTAEPRW